MRSDPCSWGPVVPTAFFWGKSLEKSWQGGNEYGNGCKGGGGEAGEEGGGRGGGKGKGGGGKKDKEKNNSDKI